MCLAIPRAEKDEDENLQSACSVQGNYFPPGEGNLCAICKVTNIPNTDIFDIFNVFRL